MVAAAGDDNNNNSICYPASNPDVIAVGSVVRTLNISPDSNLSNDIELFAPGDSIYTISGLHGFNFGNGSSFATAIVSGVAALMLSVCPNLAGSAVRSILQNTAREINNNGSGTTYGYGLVDAYEAVYTAVVARISQISGPMIPGSPSTYSVENLPSGWHVVWSIQGQTTLPSYCTTNYPLANQLQIDNSGKQHIKETLVAKVYNDNWFYVKTLTLYIDTSGGFSGSYTQTIPLPYEVLSGHIYDGNSIWVKQGYDVVMTSSDFNGATVSYTSPSPYPTISTSGNTVTVRLHASTMFSNCLLHVVKVIEFRLRANPTLLIDPILMANISNEGNSVVNIVLSRREGDVETRLGDEESWQLTIYNYTTGELVCNQQVSGASVSIDSSKWTSGIYIVRIKMGDKEIVQKFNLE